MTPEDSHSEERQQSAALIGISFAPSDHQECFFLHNYPDSSGRWHTGRTKQQLQVKKKKGAYSGRRFTLEEKARAERSGLQLYNLKG